MKEQKNEENIELLNESKQKEEIAKSACAYTHLCMDSIDQLHTLIVQILKQIENENIPTESKRLIFNAFLMALYSDLIGHILTTESAISISKLLYEHFERFKVLEECEAKKKISI
ncbi:hypothetical protein C4573_02170 [Candidatus Woesearchaeota archaeon]|nr:MAG: hypothetical protein C4573_02170 [Candidatus Woesearchaeota archaeon]